MEKYPALQVSFNLDGTKKDILQLLKEREKMLEIEDIENVNDFYEMIIKHRLNIGNGLEGVKEEFLKLTEYIQRTGTEDKFIFDIARYQLENRLRAKPEQIRDIMDTLYKISLKNSNNSNLSKDNNLEDSAERDS